MTRQLTVTLETVTPMFLAGVDNQTPELRPPSVRGQLRYWLRAALGAVVGDNLEALKRAEAEIFGDTNGTGAVQIRRMRWVGNPPQPIREDALPHPSARSAYMWGFPAGERFELILTQHTNNQATWLAAVSSLLLMISIGGIGRRCRRGWGTVKIAGFDLSQANLVEGWAELFSASPITSTEWINYVAKIIRVSKIGIKPLLVDFGISNSSRIKKQDYTVLAPNLIKMFESPSYPTVKQVISDFGEKEHIALKNKSLPLRSIGYARGGRQASPLWLRVLPVTNRNNKVSYIILATLFEVDFEGKDFEAVRKFLISANFSEVSQ